MVSPAVLPRLADSASSSLETVAAASVGASVGSSELVVASGADSPPQAARSITTAIASRMPVNALNLALFIPFFPIT